MPWLLLPEAKNIVNTVVLGFRGAKQRENNTCVTIFRDKMCCKNKKNNKKNNKNKNNNNNHNDDDDDHNNNNNNQQQQQQQPEEEEKEEEEQQQQEEAHKCDKKMCCKLRYEKNIILGSAPARTAEHMNNTNAHTTIHNYVMASPVCEALQL